MKFIDLRRQYEKLENEINENIQKVLEHEQFIMGPEVAELERELAEYTGRKYAFTCSSGTDALVIPLMSYGLKKTDAVFVPSFTFFAFGGRCGINSSSCRITPSAYLHIFSAFLFLFSKPEIKSSVSI